MSSKSKTTKSPIGVVLTTWGVLILGCWNLGRAIAIRQQLALFRQLEMSPNPAGRLVMAGAWGLIFVLLAILLRAHRPVTRLAIPLALTLYALYNLGLLAFSVQSALAQQSWPIQTLGYLFTILWAVWVLLRPGSPTYWQHNQHLSK